MVKDGYYIFLFLDVIGYTTIMILDNDVNLIEDYRERYEYEGIDYKLFFAKNDYWLLRKTIRLVQKYNVSVRDMTGHFLRVCVYYRCDEALEALIAVLPEEWRLNIL